MHVRRRVLHRRRRGVLLLLRLPRVDAKQGVGAPHGAACTAIVRPQVRPGRSERRLWCAGEAVQGVARSEERLVGAQGRQAREVVSGEVGICC